MPTELMSGVYWVGVVDWGLRHFHGHELSTHRGSAYNSYLIVDEKVALVDTVWGPFQDEFMENLREVIDPARIDYVVANHSETDHSGSLPAVMRHATNAALIVSKRGRESVEGHYHQPWNFRAVQTGDRVHLGASDLVFIEAPLCHWPDSMFTYVTGRNLLLPNDAFGQHYASDFRYNDQVDQEELYEEAVKYYANILAPYSKMVARKIDEVLALSLPVDMIAPSHGIIWRKDPLQIVTKYQVWAAQKPTRKAIVVFDTMWNATRKMSEAVGEGLAQSGVPHKILHAAITDRNDILTEIFTAGAVVLGSPTLNNGLLPGLAPLLEDLRGLKFQNKVGAAFGSYGWSGECVKLLEEHLTRDGVKLAAPGVLAKWQPREDDLEMCRALGRAVAETLPAE